MRIGLINELTGRPNGPRPAPTWASVSERARTAENVGFDMFVFEDALLFRGETATSGAWESVSIAAALAATTETMHLGQSVVNAPYRSPALMAKIAETLDEISGGRYVLGIGAGNTADSDYEAFGFPTDRRFSRFAEAVEIIATLLRTGKADFTGEFYSARDAELVLRGPRPHGPPINIAGRGPKMLRLAARHADAWNWWGYDETLDEIRERIGPTLAALDDACRDEGRDPETLERTFDLYTVVPEGFSPEGAEVTKPIAGSSAEIAAYILGLADLGFGEVRCNVYPYTVDAVAAMQPIVELVHAS